MIVLRVSLISWISDFTVLIRNFGCCRKWLIMKKRANKVERSFSVNAYVAFLRRKAKYTLLPGLFRLKTNIIGLHGAKQLRPRLNRFDGSRYRVEVRAEHSDHD